MHGKDGSATLTRQSRPRERDRARARTSESERAGQREVPHGGQVQSRGPTRWRRTEHGEGGAERRRRARRRPGPGQKGSVMKLAVRTTKGEESSFRTSSHDITDGHGAQAHLACAVRAAAEAGKRGARQVANSMKKKRKAAQKRVRDDPVAGGFKPREKDTRKGQQMQQKCPPPGARQPARGKYDVNADATSQNLHYWFPSSCARACATAKDHSRPQSRRGCWARRRPRQRARRRPASPG